MQPDNEQIIKEISEAEQYLRSLLERLLALRATPRNLGDVVQALEIINRSYSDSPQLVGQYIGHGYAHNSELSPSSIDQIAKAIKEAIASGINT
ncbi:hypothetical protein [Nostoc punctiforme]|uniref:Uncharacterized protein n=1 Tax=Nostoc punctiforme NIES-2108 TaxID=1356359 RepID=A0A367S268_NOSPU|nr:hypothetical protein [Nostoc punctiforme]RCJ42083.1 hypothetical protein A6769_38115 [Nostoc punctiforme NIES-2108]